MQQQLRIISVLLLMVLARVVQAQTQPVNEVDPFIGTANQKSVKPNWKNGETFPGAIVPWGMVSVSPHNAPGSKSGYMHGQPFLYGFGHVQLSGVGCSDLGNILLMPTVGAIKTNPDAYKSKYGNETASAGYYNTMLLSGNIKAEMTATTHTGISRYTFPAGVDEANILIDASITQNKIYMPAPGHVKIKAKNEVEGWTQSGHFCGAPNQEQKVYFVARFSRPADAMGTWLGDSLSIATEQSGKSVGAYLRFNARRGLTIDVKVGISYVSTENARLNLNAEQPGFDFDGVRQKAKNDWNKALSVIEVEGGTPAQRKIFYTGLYHMLLHPGVFSDTNGDYLTMGHKAVARANDYTRYHVYSLWDSYRNEHVFLTLFYPERQQDMIRSLLEMYKEDGWLPKWEIAGNDAHVMVGDPAPVAITETYMNGLRGFDAQLAYRAMKHNATDTVNNPIRRDLGKYLYHHYVPANIRGSVSETLEYAASDNAIAQMAKALGYQQDYELFSGHSYYYKNLYDASTGFLRPKNADGTWYAPFNQDEFKGTGFIEGTAWNYLFAPVFDVKGLAQLMGGGQTYVKRLQQVFDENKFVLYNEPDIAYPYLFHYFKNEDWRAAKAIHDGMADNYNTSPGGLPGNDDCGALSAWYVFSAMGFYPADPVSGQFSLGSPVFKKITIHLDQHYYKGKTFVINAPDASDQHIYIASKKLNGHTYELPYISHTDIQNGGRLDIEMTAVKP